MVNSESSDDEAIQIPKWKLIFTLKELLQTDENVCAKTAKTTKRKRAKSSLNAFQKQHLEGWNTDSFHSMSYMYRLCELGKQLTTTHRWAATARIFSSVARQIFHCPVVVWKMGALCLASHQETSDELLHNFANTMGQLGRSAVSCIILDYVVHLLCTGEYQEARHFVEAHMNRLNYDHTSKERAILSGYRGIIEYLTWMEKRNLHNSDEIPGNQLQSITTETEVVLIAERAIEFLKQSFSHSGNFDVFVMKLFDLLEYYERLDELREVLKSYIRFNPNHPTPYEFLYSYLEKYSPDEDDEQINVLKRLTEICPSHPLVLTLCNLLPDEDFLLKMEYLVNLVDYDEWCNDRAVWQALVRVMTTDALRCKEYIKKNAYIKLWKDRSTWWPAYHFKIKNICITDHASAELVACKAIVVAVMYSVDGREHDFIKAVKRQLAVGDWKAEMDYLDKTLAVAHLLSAVYKIPEREAAVLNRRAERTVSCSYYKSSQLHKHKKTVNKRKPSARRKKKTTSFQSHTKASKSIRRRRNPHNVITVCNMVNLQQQADSSSSSEIKQMPVSNRSVKTRGRPKTYEIIRIQNTSGSSSCTATSSSSESEDSEKPRGQPNSRVFRLTNYRKARNLKVVERRNKLKMTTSDSSKTSESDSSLSYEIVKTSSAQKKNKTMANPVSAFPKKSRQTSSRKCDSGKRTFRKKDNVVDSKDKRNYSPESSRIPPTEIVRAGDIQCSPPVNSFSDKDSSSIIDHLKCKRVSVVLQRINASDYSL